ncbi:histidine phosphatase family protein [Micromonospora sp. DT62]|uniref:histidine phosphatase family protein n=1 Tax=Micromonospora sp. DT62 TaxID=3416521 RepID=UPI003CFAA8DB
MTLLLVRHALTRQEPGRPVAEWDLDPSGEAAMVALAQLPVWSGTRLFASTEDKAVRTALALPGDGPVTRVADLGEIRRGGWTDDYARRAADHFIHPMRPSAPGWETADDGFRRFDAAMRRIVAATPGPLAVVSHGLVLTGWLSRIADLDRTDLDFWRELRFPDAFLLSTEGVARWLGGDTDRRPTVTRVTDAAGVTGGSAER